MTETTGYIDFRYQGETFKTWYNLIGTIKAGGPTPVVVLHGGPGVPNPYVAPHKDLHDALGGAPILFYDQVGCGHSTHLRNKPASFWTVDLFKDELDNVLDHFGIASHFDIVGHSWGGMLAADYITSRHPVGLRRLVLADSPASMELWTQSVRKLLTRMPKEARDAIVKHEKQGTTDDPEYKKWVMVFYKKHLCTVDPWPETLMEAFNSSEEDKTVYYTMIGPSEFTITGSLKTWSVIGKLDAIKVPTLVTNAVEDEAQDEVIKPFLDEIPNNKWVKFKKSSHMAFYEERQTYIKVLADFLS